MDYEAQKVTSSRSQHGQRMSLKGDKENCVLVWSILPLIFQMIRGSVAPSLFRFPLDDLWNIIALVKLQSSLQIRGYGNNIMLEEPS